jgi:hypothetical protein
VATADEENGLYMVFASVLFLNYKIIGDHERPISKAGSDKRLVWLFSIHMD